MRARVCVCGRHFVRPLVSLGMLPERSLADFSFDLKSTKASLAFRPGEILRLCRREIDA